MGGTNTLKQQVLDRLHLLKSGLLAYPVNAALTANQFVTLATVDIGSININRIQVFVYGHSDGGGATSIPNMGNMLFISSNSLIAAYKITGRTVSIGFVCSGAGFTPSAPFRNLSMGYYVMYY